MGSMLLRGLSCPCAAMRLADLHTLPLLCFSLAAVLKAMETSDHELKPMK
jgi:hypothetical protein